jgi:hypothetical protein
MHVAENIPVIIDDRHGSNVTYYSNILPKEMFEDIKGLIRRRKWKNLFMLN